MIIVYPLIHQLDYTELKFSLRSLEKHLPKHEVVIVGPRPDWITNITQINLNDLPNKKQLNIRRKILAALQYDREIFFMNDDYFLLTPISPKTFPYYYFGALKSIGESGARPLMTQLEAQNRPTLHFDIHVPIRYERGKFEQLESFTADCIIKSMYCNFHQVEGKQLPDMKINTSVTPDKLKSMIKDHPCFSTGPNGLKSALPLLEELYPKPSKFEL